jgi:HEAT repeat protein
MQSTEIQALVAELNCESRITCRKARRALVGKGQPAVPHLASALKQGQGILPLEATKALGSIGGPQAIKALIQALEDERFEVRWSAAEALIKIGREAVAPLLEALVKKGDSPWLRDDAHHVFSDTEDLKMRLFLAPVLKALDDDLPRLEVPLAAKKALDALKHP